MSHWDKIMEALKSLPEYKYQRSDIDFIYTKDIEQFYKNQRIPWADTEAPIEGAEPLNSQGKPYEDLHPRRLNVYTCAAGHDTVTIDIDHGTTPMFMGCKTCGVQATSHMYRVSPDLIPEWEWYKPNPSEVKDFEMDHVQQGGLLLRPYTGHSTYKEVPAKFSQDIYRFATAWKKKNPRASDREFKRAMIKKFPNSFE